MTDIDDQLATWCDANKRTTNTSADLLRIPGDAIVVHEKIRPEVDARRHRHRVR